MDKYDYVYYKSNFIKKFNLLLDIRYSNIPKNKRRRKFFEEYRNRYYSDIEKKAKNWFREDYDTRTSPVMETLINICNLLDCDIDYFLTGQTAFHSTFNHASQYIGLDYETVERISKYSPEEKEILNVSIYKNSNNPILKNSDYFKSLIESIEKYSISCHISSITIKNWVTDNEEKLSYTTDNARIEAINREETRKGLETLLNCIYSEYHSIAMKMADNKLEEIRQSTKRMHAEIEKLKGSD